MHPNFVQDQPLNNSVSLRPRAVPLGVNNRAIHSRDYVGVALKAEEEYVNNHD